MGDWKPEALQVGVEIMWTPTIAVDSPCESGWRTWGDTDDTGFMWIFKSEYAYRYICIYICIFIFLDTDIMFIHIICFTLFPYGETPYVSISPVVPFAGINLQVLRACDVSPLTPVYGWDNEIHVSFIVSSSSHGKTAVFVLRRT